MRSAPGFQLEITPSRSRPMIAYSSMAAASSPRRSSPAPFELIINSLVVEPGAQRSWYFAHTSVGKPPCIETDRLRVKQLSKLLPDEVTPANPRCLRVTAYSLVAAAPHRDLPEITTDHPQVSEGVLHPALPLAIRAVLDRDHELGPHPHHTVCCRIWVGHV